MNRLTKYLIITYSVLIALIIIGVSFNAYYNAHNKTTDTAKNTSQKIHLAENSLNKIIRTSFLIGFPILVIIMSALYLYKEKQGYLKSLIIPISYFILAFISASIWLFLFATIDQGLIIMYFSIQIISTIILALITNAIIVLIIKKQFY